MRILAPFLVMAALGLVGVASLAPTLGPTLVRIRALPGMAERSDAELVLLSLVQPAVLAIVGALIGTLLADRVGLRSVLVSALRGEPGPRLAGPTAVLAIGLGFAAGAAILVLDLAFNAVAGGWSGSDFGQAGSLPQKVSALLYGGVTEEIIMRFGLMTLLVWMGSRLVPGVFARRPAAVIVPAIVTTALLFGLGHLPRLFAVTDPGTALIVRIVALNVVAGLAYGWLYWRHSLEHAMLAHVATHVAFWTLGPVLMAAAASFG